MDKQDSALRDREGALAFWKPLERIEKKLDGLQQLVERIFNNQNELSLQEKKDMAATQADLDAILATVNTDLTTLQTATAAIIAKLQSVSAGQPAPDFTAEVTQLQTIDSALNALSTADSTATNPPVATTSAAVKKS
jgi:hypothetical protein